MTRYNSNGNLYRRLFVEHNGSGPWPCYGCDEEVPSDGLTVHHIDGNHFNNDPENLTSMHHGCHLRLHHTGRKMSVETRAKLAAHHRGMVNSPETRAKISANNKGRPKNAPLFKCAQCPMISTGGGISKHQRSSSGHSGRIDTGRHLYDEQ